MSYLTAYRSQSAKYGGDGVKAFKPPPAPFKPQTKPPGANDNAPRPANDNASRVAKAMLRYPPKALRVLKIHPWLRVLDLGLEVWKLAHDNDFLGVMPTADLVSNGWVTQVQGSCPRGLPPVGYNWGSGNSPWTGGNCFSNGVVVTWNGLLEPLPINTGQLRFIRYLGGYYNTSASRFMSVDLKYRPSGDVAAGTYIYRRVVTPRPARPAIAPDLLPILQPMPYPVPLPLGVVPRNDPIGSQRNNGDKRPRFTPRTPPPKGVKEKKVRALSGLVGLIQSGGHVLTEALDLLEALHEALPKEYQAKAVFKGGKWWNASPQAKAQAIYNNFDKMDLNEAVKNLIANEVGDRILGRANARVDQFLNRTPIGRVTRGVAF